MSASAIVATLQDLQRQQKLLAEFILALAVIGLRRQNTNCVLGIGGAAVIGFAAEDREQDGGRHAVLPLDGVERAAILRQELAALRREPLDRRLFQIIGRRLDEFRLAGRRLLRPARQDEIGQRQIGLEPARRGVESRARNAERMRLAATAPAARPGNRCRHRRARSKLQLK